MVRLLKSKEVILDILKSRTKVDEVTGCWLYTGNIASIGYGRLTMGKSYYEYTHRLSAYIHHKLDLEDRESMALHRRYCPNRHCWNPDHLYVGTQKENVADYRALGKLPRNKLSERTSCKNGHKYVEGSYSIQRRKGRRCRICTMICADKSRAKKRLNKKEVLEIDNGKT